MMNQLLFSLRLSILRNEARRLTRYHPGTKVSIVVESEWMCFEFRSPNHSTVDSYESALIGQPPSRESSRQKIHSFSSKVRNAWFRSSNAGHQIRFVTEEEERMGLL